MSTSQITRWSGDKPVRDVVWEAVQELTRKDTNSRICTQRSLLAHFEEVSRLQYGYSNVGPDLLREVPINSSYHHFSGNHKYLLVESDLEFIVYTTLKRDKVEE